MAAIINDPLVQVRPGEIEVDAVYRVLDTDLAKAWDVSLGSKYAQIGGYSISGDGFQSHWVHLRARYDTLYTNERLQGTDTHICIEVPGEGWIVMAECAKRTCRIVAYRPTYYTS